MTLLVRNEQDIVRENLDFHYKSGVDFVVATDNLSTDSTPDILREYEKQGRLHMIREEQDDYSQDIWVTRMAQLACTRFQADWIINNDADEFWWPVSGNLKTALSEYGTKIGVVVCPRLNFVCRPVCGDVPFWEVMVYRQTDPKNELGRPLPPKVCHRGSPAVEVGMGNHNVNNVEGERVQSKDIEILHFPIRSWKQLITKVQYGGAALNRNKSFSTAVIKRWRMQYEMMQRGMLNEYFQNLVYCDAQLQKSLLERSLIEDVRLRQYMQGLSTTC